MVNIIVIAVLLAILGLAAGYVVHSRKKGRKCIGCPGDCGKCTGNCTSKY